MTASHPVAQSATYTRAEQPASTRAPSLRGLAWVAWRQQRAALLILALLAAGLSVRLAVSGLRLRAAIAALTRAHCEPQAFQACQSLYNRAAAYGPGWLNGLIVLPFVAAVFVAAPLIARGYETGSLRFALTQGVRRGRWAAAQFLVPAVAGVLSCVVPALVGAWYLGLLNSPVLGSQTSRWEPVSFNITPLTLPSWLLLGLSAGLLAAAVFRRTVPAMAATLAGAAVAAAVIDHRSLLPTALLPIGASAKRLAAPMWTECSGRGCSFPDPAGQTSGSGIIVHGWFVHGGHALTPAQSTFLAARVPRQLIQAANQAAKPATLARWLTARHYSYWISFQPGRRYWMIQGEQAAILLVLAAMLAGTAIWLLRRRPV